MLQPIASFHTDAEGHWVARLACGHHQHTRHDPPWFQRPWVITPHGRQAALGRTLDCRKCDQGAPPDPPPARPEDAAPGVGAPAPAAAESETASTPAAAPAPPVAPGSAAP